LDQFGVLSFEERASSSGRVSKWCSTSGAICNGCSDKTQGLSGTEKTFNLRAEEEAWVVGVESEMALGIYVSRAGSTTLKDVPDRYRIEISPAKYPGVCFCLRPGSYPTTLVSMILLQRSIRLSLPNNAMNEGKRLPPNREHHFTQLSRLFNVSIKVRGILPMGNPARQIRMGALRSARGRQELPASDGPWLVWTEKTNACELLQGSCLQDRPKMLTDLSQ
jgi:hypothetical protein